MALSLTDRLILLTISECDNCEAGFPEEALYGDLDDVHWHFYSRLEGRTPPSRSDVAGRVRELIADGYVVWRRGGPIAHMLPGYSGLDTEGLALTDAGKREAQSFDGWLDDPALVERSRQFAESYIMQCCRGLPFKPTVPAYLPPAISPLPELEFEESQLRMTYFSDDLHVIIEQRSEENSNWLAAGEEEHRESLAGVRMVVKEGQMTSI